MAGPGTETVSYCKAFPMGEAICVCRWASRGSWHWGPCPGKFDIRIHLKLGFCAKFDLFVLGFLPSPSVWFFLMKLSLAGTASVRLNSHKCLLLVLFSMQLPPAVCSWDVIWCLHHWNHDPWRTDQVPVAGKGVIWVGGCEVGGSS